MTSLDEKYDSAFLAILQNEGKIPSFLDQLFSFLYRRTDFFITMKTQHEKMGFPPGVALKLVVDAFKKFETRAKKDAERKERLQREKEAKEKLTEVVDMETESPVVNEVEITTQVQDNTETVVPKETECRSANADCSSDEVNISQSNSEPVRSRIAETAPSKEEKSAQNKVQAENKTEKKAHSVSEQNKVDSDARVEKSDTEIVENTTRAEGGEENEKQESTGKTDKNASDEDDDPELTKQQKEFQACPESYNGAIRDNYCWSQSITDVDVSIKVPAYIKRGKDVIVSIGKKRLKASCKTDSGSSKTLCEGELSWDIRQEESMWSLVPGEHIHVNLEKIQERWWEALLTDEPKISVRKIDPSRPVTDLDDEAQAKISEMMYNEHQKRLGKPQSHEQKVHGMLKKAWDAEGSPFKGTPFDPNKVNVSSDGGMGFPPK